VYVSTASPADCGILLMAVIALVIERGGEEYSSVVILEMVSLTPLSYHVEYETSL
jgi:hypothetical protein